MEVRGGPSEGRELFVRLPLRPRRVRGKVKPPAPQAIDQVTLSYSSGLGKKNELLGVLGQPLQTTHIYLGDVLIQ